MQGLFGTSAEEGDSEWLSVSDLMAGLMVIFLFIAIVYIKPLSDQNSQMTEIAQTWKEQEERIYSALIDEFEDDLQRWNAEIEEETLLIRFKSPDVLFEQGDDSLRPGFRQILSDFFPRYVRVLTPFRDSLEELRIEGHTSSEWRSGVSGEDAYIRNMKLSQDRTRAVLDYVLGLDRLVKDRSWLQQLVTANGLSSSRLMLDDGEGVEDPERSRRVEFRVRTTARDEIVRIIEAAQ